MNNVLEILMKYFVNIENCISIYLLYIFFNNPLFCANHNDPIGLRFLCLSSNKWCISDLHPYPYESEYCTGQRANAHRIKNHGRVSLHRHRVLVTAQGKGLCVSKDTVITAQLSGDRLFLWKVLRRCCLITNPQRWPYRDRSCFTYSEVQVPLV